VIGSIEIHGVAQTLAGRMLDCVLVGTVLAVSVAILLRALRQRGPATRFAILFAALMGIAGLLWFDGWTSSGVHRQVSLITIPATWALYLLCAWALISGIALLRLGLGLWQLQRIRSTSTVVDGSELDPLLQTTFDSMQRIRRVQLSTSDRVQVPTVLGLINPAVVLPTWALTELSPAELHAVVLHEFAHLRRWDDWTNLTQKLVRAVLFFHPAVCWIDSQLTLEREMACDDVVLAETTNPRAYAQCLVSMAEKGFLRRSLTLAQAVVGRVQQMSARVTRILDMHRRTERPVSRGVWKPAVGFVGVLSIVCLVWSPRASRLIGFGSPGQPAPVAVAAQVDTGSLPSSYVLPASWKSPEQAVVVRPHHHAKQASAPARVEKKVPDNGLVMQARASKQAEVLQPVQAVFVLVEDQRFAADGSMVWTIRIVGFTVSHPSASTDNQQVPRKI
jgi:beta-lactamase regulating signal transducer with metallopeptidase domain